MPQSSIHSKPMFPIVTFLVAVCVRETLAWQASFGNCPVVIDESCQSDDIKFTLYTKTERTALNPFKPILPKSFNPVIPLKILIHGYGGLQLDKAIKNVSEAYQDVGYNTILADWSPLATVPCYVTAYLNTWHVGQCVAILATSLIPLGISPSLIHTIGFSLGAHIAGFAGAHLRRTLGFSFQRITGLDPALPFFATLNHNWKLSAKNAKFVDVIHTSAGSFGKIEASGHVDFYVNGGSDQPACENSNYPPLCSHMMAGAYFAESIRGNGLFIGEKCSSLTNYHLNQCHSKKKAIMGEHVSFKSRGSYFVETNDRPPYALD